MDYKDGCKKVIVYFGTAYEYTTFWTPEASQIFDDYLTMRKADNEYLTPDSPAYRTTYALGSLKAKPMSLSAIQAVVRRAVTRVGLRIPSDKINGRFETMMDHGFRKRWNTIVKNTDGMKIITAEKMMGHSITAVPLDETYNIPDDEKLFKEFKKAIPELTLDSTARKQAEIENLKNEKDETARIKDEFEQFKVDTQKQIEDLQQKQQRHELANSKK